MTTTRGQHLIGKEIGSFILERLLGYGGSSAVFLARSRSSEKRVAVKVFLPRSTLDGQMRKSFYQRFLREAEAASQLDHPHILSIYSYGEHEGLPYIIMPYMSGGTLSEYLQRHGPLALHEAQRYLEQIAAALDYAHAHGCVHCDVKPANLLLDGAGNVALSDFGIVRLLQPETEAGNGHKATEGNGSKPAKKASSEMLMGTPDYVSPEQALGEPLDGRSDIYSLGATLYALLVGRPPFKADTPIALALMHVHEAPTPVGLLRADVTPQLDFVISKALAKWPEGRFQTAGAFSAAFTLALKEATEPLQPPSQPVRVLERSNGSAKFPLPISASPTVASPSVQIKQVAKPRFSRWRAALLISLVVAFVLGFLVVALYLGGVAGQHLRTTVGTVTPLGPRPPFDALADDQQNWPLSSTFFFQRGAYIIQNPASLGVPAMAFYSNHIYKNFYLQVTTSELQGSFNSADYYGVAFRASSDQSSYYLFDVTAWNHGQYGFLRYDGGDHWTTLAYGAAPIFQALPGQKNTLRVEAQNSSFTLFINGQQVRDPLHDQSDQAHFTGALGLVVEEQQSEVAFSHLSIGA